MIKSMQLFCGILIMLPLFSCIPEIIPQDAFLDTPSRYYRNGMKLFQAGKAEASHSEFKRALELDREYAPGLVGIGLVAGLKENYDDAMKKMLIAELYTRNRQEAMLVQVGYMRIFMMGREKISENWLEMVEERYRKAILLGPDFPDPYFVMGMAYKLSSMPEKAMEQFLRVVEMNREFAYEASFEMLKIQAMGSTQ